MFSNLLKIILVNLPEIC